MAETDREMPATTDPQVATGIGKDERARKLVASMLVAKIADIKPQLDFASELGFVYPIVEQAAGVKGREAVAILESLTDRGIFKKSFFDRLLRCPRCQSVNLRPSTHCPKCGSGDIVRGRILEHMACGYVGVEDEFAARGRYVCPRCKLELRTLGADYQSRGVLRKCRNCGEVFSVPLVKWRCLKCSSLVGEDEVQEVAVYSYALDEAQRNWLEFELQPKVKFLEFLRQHGYDISENARVKGRSGAEHRIDILATRDDGVITHTIAIGVEIGRDKIGLERILDFDVKAYDGGIHDKVMIIIPALGEEAAKFASYQRIKVFEPRDLDMLLSNPSRPGRRAIKAPFEFKSRSQLIDYLVGQGYQVKEDAEVKGRSGASHRIDLLATKNEGLITHRIAIAVEVDDKPMGLDRVFSFDDKAYDAGVMDRVFIAIPGLTREARQFADRQGIRVFEVEKLEPAA
jgi:hypothetical protein